MPLTWKISLGRIEANSFYRLSPSLGWARLPAAWSQRCISVVLWGLQLCSGLRFCTAPCVPHTSLQRRNVTTSVRHSAKRTGSGALQHKRLFPFPVQHFQFKTNQFLPQDVCKETLGNAAKTTASWSCNVNIYTVSLTCTEVTIFQLKYTYWQKCSYADCKSVYK